jgi:hypothetical protein
LGIKNCDVLPQGLRTDKSSKHYLISHFCSAVLARKGARAK